MNNQARHLITTADERTWKFDRPVVFMGEWCKSYNKKHLWKEMDAETLAPLGPGLEEKDQLYAKARAIEAQILPVLINLLNQHHGLDYSDRAWRILIGPWLRRNIDVIFNRLNTLQKCLQTYVLSGVTVVKTQATLAPSDALSALGCYGRDDWNGALFARILEVLNVKNCPVEWLPDLNLTVAPIKVDLPSRSMVKMLLKWLAFKVGSLSRWLARKNDAFFIHTYLPAFEQVKLQLAMRQFPQFWTIPGLNLKNKVDHTLRQKLAKQCAEMVGGGQASIIAGMVIETLPSCYLEEFSSLLKTVETLPFPVNPRFIFTSNNFEANEVFQLWVALKTQSGSKYYVGQHGNNYGTHKLMVETVEEITSDRFLTWGWRAGLPQHTPAFIFKIPGSVASLKNDPNGGLLLVEDILGHRVYVWDRPYDFELYLNEQISFSKRLSDRIKQRLTVRLHYTHSSFNACEIERWHDADPTINVEPGRIKFKQLLRESRLVVYGYDSTGILESLAMNLPTIVLMQNKLDFLRNEALPYYQLLLEAGIVHILPETAADMVNQVWDNVDEWWRTEKVQAARRIFCDNYSRLSVQPVKDLIEILQ